MTAVRSSRYSVVRGLARGLSILRALNDRPPGAWSLVELADHVDIHRTTVKRICETLHDLGYVSVDAETGRYRLASSVRSLAAGFRDDDALVDVARRLMPELIEKLVWPVFLSLPERHAMVSRIENHHLSPLAFHRTTLGHRFPFHTTATGCAYIAACQLEERRELLRGDCPPNTRSRGVGVLERRVASRVIEGFGIIDSGWGNFRNFSAIALPVYVGRRPSGSLTMGFPTRAMTSRQAIERFGDRMRAETDRIGIAACAAMAEPANVPSKA